MARRQKAVQCALPEDRCRELVEKLCRTYKWEVRPVPGVHLVLFTSEDRWVAFGWSWQDVFACFCESAYGLNYPFNDIPRWSRQCSSPEELAVKIDLNCA